jgi:hypothetical protein
LTECAQDLIGARKARSLLASQGLTFEPEQIARHKQRYMAPEKSLHSDGITVGQYDYRASSTCCSASAVR